MKANGEWRYWPERPWCWSTHPDEEEEAEGYVAEGVVFDPHQAPPEEFYPDDGVRDEREVEMTRRMTTESAALARGSQQSTRGSEKSAPAAGAEQSARRVTFGA